MRLADEALPTLVAFGEPLLRAMNAMNVARFAKNMNVNIFRYVVKKLSGVASPIGLENQ